MHRFWLLLLLFVLPVQMSWAAIHHCDDTASEVAVVLAAAAEATGDSAVAPSDEAVAADASAKNAPSAHPCHGLHEIMGHATQSVVEAAKEMVLAGSQPIFRPSALASRHERPQWAAA